MQIYNKNLFIKKIVLYLHYSSIRSLPKHIGTASECTFHPVKNQTYELQINIAHFKKIYKNT